jgi:hypothetical protein
MTVEPPRRLSIATINGKATSRPQITRLQAAAVPPIRVARRFLRHCGLGKLKVRRIALFSTAADRELASSARHIVRKRCSLPRPSRVGRHWLTSAGLAVVAWAGLWCFATAQSPEPMPAPAEPKPKPAGEAKEVKPQVFYFKDKDGNLLPIPDLPYEEIKRLYDLDRGLKANPPAYVLGTVKIDGKVEGGKAALDVDLSVDITASGNAWVRVPLRFPSAVLREPPKHDGEGKVFFEFDPNGEGYVCWLQAAEKSQHVLHCKFLATLQQAGEEYRLSLSAPHATRGEMTLRVPQAKAQARMTRRAEVEKQDVEADGAGSKISVVGAIGDFQIAWQTTGSEAPKPRQTVVANTSVVVKLEGSRRITSEARLKLSSFGTPLSTFAVRLPPGMRLASFDQTTAQLTVLKPETDGVSKLEVQVVEVRLNTKTNGPVEVLLVAEHLREASAPDQPFDVGGFEVLDAVKQWGTVDLVVEGEQSAVWVEGANVRRTDDPAASEARGIKPVARFEFDAQPFSLQVQLAPRRTRVSVEPLYVVYVENHQLRLDATLKYKVRGAKALNLEYDFDGWTIDRVGPETLVQTESLLPEKKSPLTIPLVPTGIPASGEFEIKVLAHRDLPSDARDVRFDVPRPANSNLTPGGLVIVPADNVELSAHVADLQGLASDPLPSTIKLPARQQTPQFYRELGGGTVARYSATMEVRQRLVSVASTSHVRFELGRALVDQHLTYNVAYVPLRNLELDVPLAVWESGQLQVSLADAALPVVLSTPSESSPTPAAGRVHVNVDLMGERIGRLDVVVQYSVPLPTIGKDAAPVALPLVLPLVEGQLARTPMTMHVAQRDRIEATVRDAAWSVVQPLQPAHVDEVETVWNHPTGTPELQLELKLQQAGNSGQISVEQAWVQTWLTSDSRQDRAVFRVANATDRLRLQMPPNVSESDLIAVAIDGRRIGRRRLDSEGVLIVELPPAQQATTHVVEVWYSFGNGRPSIGAMELIAPQILGAGEARRAYWQLVTGSNEHLLSGPTQLSPDMRWQWEGTHFGRAGRLSQSELEQWIGASVQTELPTSVNTFLYSSFGSLPKIEVRTAARRTILLGCSGFVLVAGLALLYLPLARHPATLLLGGVAIAALAIWNPDAAVLAAEAALAGLACALFAKVLASLYGRRSGAGMTLRIPSPSAIEAKSTEPHLRYEASSQGTTATLPLVTIGHGEPDA